MASVPIIELTQVDNGEKFYPLTHVEAVVGLDDLSFFTLDESGNVTLRPQYQNLWVPGWLAAGGVGTGGSGGGGLIETVYTWTELQAMASAPADDVTAAVNARGVYEIWQAVKALQDEPAGIVSITSQQDGTVDFTFGNGDVTTVDLNHRHPDLEAAIAAIQSLELVPVVALPDASEDTIGKIYLVPSSNPKTENVKDEYVTIRSGSEGAYTYSWEQIGTTAVDLTPYATKVTGATNGNFAGLDANGNLVDSGHKHGDYVTALGTNGNYLTWTKNGVANDLTVPFATKATQDGDGNTIADYYVTKTTAQDISGTKTISGVDTFLFSAVEDSVKIAGEATNSVMYSPLSWNAWHDHFAFLRSHSIRDKQKTSDGTTWSDSDIDISNLFIHKETTSVAILSASDLAFRFTLYSNQFHSCQIRWIALGVNYSSPFSKFATHVEISSDNATWTTLFNGDVTRNQRTVFLRTRSFPSSQTYLRFTFTKTTNLTTGSVNLNSISGLTMRKGNQGLGREYSYPFNWDSSFNLLPVNLGSHNLGGSSASGRWDTIYGVNGNLSGALNAAGASGADNTSYGINITNGSNRAHIGMASLMGIYSSGNIVLRPNGANSSEAGNGSLTISNSGIIANEKITSEGLTSSDVLTLSGSTSTARRIYFGDTSHYLELDQYGFHFSHGVYSDDFVSAGGIGSSSTSGGALADLADVSLSSGLASGDLLKYDGTHWVNIPQSQIVPTVSVAFDDLTSHPTTIAGYGITDAKIQGRTITLGSNSITPLTSVPDISNTYLSLVQGGMVSGDVDFEGDVLVANTIYGNDNPSGNPYWQISSNGAGSFTALTVNGASVLTSHQTVTNLAATLTPGTTQTIATIGSTNITVQVPSFASESSVTTLQGYFTNGVANNAAQLDGHSASYFATAEALSGYVRTSRTINGVDLSQNRTFYALGTSLGTSAARGTMLGVSAMSYDLSSTGSESSLIKWDTQLGAWHVYGNLFADGWVASGGIGTESGGGGYGVEEITSNQDGTVDFHFTGGDVTTVDLNHEHPQYPKYVLCADEAAYNAIANKDSSTLYLIPES